MERDFGTGLEPVLDRAVTIDELLSDAYAPLVGQKGDADLAGRRLAAWCRASSSGDWTLFVRRLARDGWSLEDVLTRFATVRRSAPEAQWMSDARWIVAALCDEPEALGPDVAFRELLAPVVSAADGHLWAGLDARMRTLLTDGALADLQAQLLTALSDLASPALYRRFSAGRDNGQNYGQFIAAMKSTEFRRLFEDKPVLLRLLASVTRQWIDASRELITRLDTDLDSIRRELLGADTTNCVAQVRGMLSDPHHFGRTVAILEFEDGARVVYKPKDLRVDAAWSALIDRLNTTAPVDLRAARLLVREGYGWTENIDNASCTGRQDFAMFFRRAGAWLALFHVFTTVDMHQENVLATGSHPVPIDLETILQTADTRFQDDGDDAGGAFKAAMQAVVDSVMTIGLLPAYGKQSTGKAFLIGGVTSNASPRVTTGWADVNTDDMRPVKVHDMAAVTTNVPHIAGSRGRLGDHLDDMISGFTEYAAFLKRCAPEDLLSGFAGLAIRNVVRPTRYYYMLLERLRDHRTMDDGVLWSAQADFTARLADWDGDTDPLWPVLRSERLAVLDLNVPHFTSETDGCDIRGDGGLSVPTAGPSGISRARARLRALDAAEIDWQVELIRQNTELLRPGPRPARVLQPILPVDRVTESDFAAEADALAAALADHAIRRGTGAAWIGLDWLDDSEMSQLVVLGPDLYNGNCGIAVFLAAHAAVTGDGRSKETTLAAVARLRETLRGRNSARVARTLGIGGGLGIGSVVYGLAVIADVLDDDDVLADAHVAATHITDDVIAADGQLDVLGGSAGAILALLRLHRRTGSAELLRIARDCGHHLLAQNRSGHVGQRMWPAGHFGHPLNGMSHGAAGFAYSLGMLASATGGSEFAAAAAECLAFERSTLDIDGWNWRDLRAADSAAAPCKWCYGAPGIGLARLASTKLAGVPCIRMPTTSNTP